MSPRALGPCHPQVHAGVVTPTILVSPDSFKGTLSAVEVAAALARGVAAAGLSADPCPVADGGEGTMEILAAAGSGTFERLRVHDPLGRLVPCRYALLADGFTAVVETAEASGLGRVDENERDPEGSSTTGTGELIAAAVEAGARRVLLALGGSAPTDGGRGAVAALQAAGGLRDVELIMLCDVTTPFEDAARIFGPQKGADAAAVCRLTTRLHAQARTLPRDPRGVPMTGAAGGLAGGLWATFGGTMVSGASAVLDTLGFDDRLRAASAVVAGEGRVDPQSVTGKIVGQIAGRAADAGVLLHVVAGQDGLDDDARRALRAASVREAGTLPGLVRAGRDIASQIKSHGT